MYCSSCGAELPEGSAFCTSCGTKMDSPAPASQPLQSQPTYDQLPYSQQPYSQQPYGQPPYDQPPKKGKPKTWLLIAGGAVLLLAIAAVLVFVVFGVGGGGWPLSGNTVQTKFVNDGVQVFSGAFSDLGNEDMVRLLTEPFDVEMDVSVSADSMPVEASIAAAYDKELLGLQAEAMGQDIKVQLDGDTLYYSMYGSVAGVQFDTDADLSKPMALKDRIAALMENFQEDASSDVDYLLVAEAMANSINEECFDKGTDQTTLTLTPEDIIDTLKTLREKAEEDEALSDALDEMELDLDEAIESGEQSMDSVDFTITITISYDGGKPVNIMLEYDDGTDYGSGTVEFGYEKTTNGKDISLTMDASGTQVEGSLNITKTGKDVEYNGEIEVSYDGTPYGSYTIEGSESWDGDEVEGAATVADNMGTEYGIDYSGTLAFGMPEEKIEDDSRFEIDKSDADVQDFEDLMGYGLMGYGLDMSAFNDYTAEPAVTEAPAESWAVSSEAPVSEVGVMGVILPTMDTTYYTTLANDISSEASYYGWEVSIYTTDDAGAENAALMMLIAQGADAVIIDPAGLDDNAIYELETACSAAGIPCAFLLDEGESTSGSVASVYCDLTYVGADMAYLCDYGEVFVIGGSQYSTATYAIEQGLLYDSDYGISDYADISVVGVAYTEGAYSASDIAASALGSYPDINTFICTDPNLSSELLQALESIGYSGSLLCYTYETTMDEMNAYVAGTYVTYEYFPVSDIAYYCVMAIADQTEYGLSPQVYTVTSYNY